MNIEALHTLDVHMTKTMDMELKKLDEEDATATAFEVITLDEVSFIPQYFSFVGSPFGSTYEMKKVYYENHQV